MYKVVLWDIDGTVLDFLAQEKAAIRSCFAHFNMGICDDDMLKDYSNINDKYWKMLERKEKTKPQILVERFEEFFAKYNLPVNLAGEFNALYQVSLGDTIVFSDNALDTIKQLKGKVLQCVVTNGTLLAQKKKLTLSGLKDIMDYIFISEEVGFDKPSVEFFDEVFKTIGDYNPDEVLIIGDSLTSDMQGGNNAKIKCCWFNPKNITYNGDLKLDYIVSDLKEVKDIVLG